MQKDIVRSLGLRKLNQVVERPDTPQIRGIVAKVPHLLAIVEPLAMPAWASSPEVTVRPPEVVPAEEKAEAVEAASVSEDVASGQGEPAAEQSSEEPDAQRHAGPGESKKAKAARAADKKSVKREAGKRGKPAKAAKK